MRPLANEKDLMAAKDRIRLKFNMRPLSERVYRWVCVSQWIPPPPNHMDDHV